MTEEPLSLAALIRREQDSSGASYMDIARASGLSKAKIGQLAQPDSRYQVRSETVTKLARGLRLPLHIVQRAAMVTAGISDGMDGRAERIALIVSELEGMSESTLDTVQAMIEAAARQDGGRG